MRSFFAICFFTGSLLAGCGGSAERKEERAGHDITERDDYKKGVALVAENRCLVCHHVSDRLTGPSYREIADKYESYPDTIISHLAGRVIRGGNGVWGEVYMTPHPQVSKKDAENMVKYILLLKSSQP